MTDPGLHLLQEAKALGYRAMQFNAVVETNSRAVGLWRWLGFRVLARVPEAFTHPRGPRRAAHDASPAVTQPTGNWRGYPDPFRGRLVWSTGSAGEGYSHSLRLKMMYRVRARTRIRSVEVIAPAVVPEPG